MRVQSIGDYYTLQGAAEALGVSYWQVWRAIRQRRMPTLQLGQTLLVLLDDVQEALPEHAAEQANDEPEHDSPGLIAALEPQVSASQAVAYYQERAQARAWTPGHLCPECGSRAVAYEEGCQKCHACGWSAC